MDYYLLIARAVERLEESTEITRRTIYDLARSAMLSKLRSLRPALNESEISQEKEALDEAIRRVEAEAVRRLRNGPSRSLARQPESPPRSIRQVVGHHQPDTSEAGDLDGQFPNRTQESSTQSPFDAAILDPTNEPRKNRRVAVLMVMTLVILVVAGLKGPGIIASLRGPSDGLNESGIGSDRSVVSKMIDRISPEPVLSSNPDAAEQKVALYEEDQDDPAGKRYSGTVLWRTESVSSGPGLAPELAVRGDIEIPDRQINMRWLLRSNNDNSLQASHTVELMFTLPTDYPHGGIASIPGLLMKKAEAASGVSLAGLSVKAAANFFLISLSTAEADIQRNVQLLKEGSWFDIPVTFDDGRRAIIAVEKGPPGERAFSKAFAAWEQ
jgi:hypothetical protein